MTPLQNIGFQVKRMRSHVDLRTKTQYFRIIHFAWDKILVSILESSQLTRDNRLQNSMDANLLYYK